MPDKDSLRRLGGGRWETRDGRFAIEPQSGTWVIVDNEQADELGLPLVRGPFGVADRREGGDRGGAEGRSPAVSPLAERIEQARQSEQARPSATAAPEVSRPEPKQPEPPPEPKWLRDLGPADQRRARDLIARLEKMGIEDPARVVRAEVADGEPALARLAIERAIARATRVVEGLVRRRSRCGHVGAPGRGRRARRELATRGRRRPPDREAGDPGVGRSGPGGQAPYSPLYACRPLNQSEPEYVTSTIPKPTTSSSAAGRPAHERWFRACR